MGIMPKQRPWVEFLPELHFKLYLHRGIMLNAAPGVCFPPQGSGETPAEFRTPAQPLPRTQRGG